MRALHRNLAASRHAGSSLNKLDAVLLEEESNAIGKPFDDTVLPRHHGLEIERDVTNLDAVLGHARLGDGIELGGIEQGLAWNAPNVQACSTKSRPLVDASDLHSELGRADRRHIAAGASTNHGKVEAIGHGCFLSRSWAEDSNDPSHTVTE